MSDVRRRRHPAMTVRVKLTLSYAGFLTAAGLVLCVIALFLLRYIPEGNIVQLDSEGATMFVPDRSDLLRVFLPATAWALVLLTVIGLVGGWFLAGRMLRPLAAIGEAARLASRGSLSHRINLRGPRDELHELADVFDTMLNQLEHQVGEQQRFAANASHELRTPLTVTRTLLEVAQADPTADLRGVLGRLQNVNERAIAVTESLLLLSRLDHQPFESGDIDVAPIAEDAVEALADLASAHNVTIDISAQPATTRGNGALLARLAANLIHNSIVHNRVDGASVWVCTEQSPDGRALLIVENTGEVLPPETVDTLVEPFERGRRRTRHNTPGHPGTGLGLAISRSIVRAHGGEFNLSARDAGGLRVVAALPANAHDNLPETGQHG